MAVERSGLGVREEHGPVVSRVATARGGQADDLERRKLLPGQADGGPDVQPGRGGKACTEDHLVGCDRDVALRQAEGRERRTLPSVRLDRIGGTTGCDPAVAQLEGDLE